MMFPYLKNFKFLHFHTGPNNTLDKFLRYPKINYSSPNKRRNATENVLTKIADLSSYSGLVCLTIRNIV